MSDHARKDRTVRRITSLYTDLHAFGRLHEGLQPLALADLVNTHYEDAAAIVVDERGALDKFIGDSILAHFNLLGDLTHPERRAVNAAIRLKAKVAERWPDISISVGVATGEAVVGFFGPSTHRVHTALGEVVTRAALLERRSHRTGFGILVDELTYAGLGADVPMVAHSIDGGAALEGTRMFEIGAPWSRTTTA
jgi:adenylate cyclase